MFIIYLCVMATLVNCHPPTSFGGITDSPFLFAIMFVYGVVTIMAQFMIYSTLFVIPVPIQLAQCF
jgi:hypothetical protein